jgi:hypothetical protein
MTPLRKWTLRATLIVGVGAAMICLFPTRARAQAVSGSIVGTITDSSGAVIPGAAVTMKDEGTAISSHTTTDASGYYSFVYVKPATYEVTVSKDGFVTGVASHVLLSVNSTVRVDMALKIGSVTQTVSVTSEAPLLQTETAQTGSTVGGAEVSELPLTTNHNFQGVETTLPGVTAAGVQHSRFIGAPTSLTIPVNGVSNMTSLTMVEGIVDTQRWGFKEYYIPPAESLAEVNVTTGNPDAELGQSIGAVINVMFKSGSNDFHGEAYETWKGDSLQARSFFQTGANGAPYHKPHFIFNQWGGNFGGPIRKGKTYFFVDYQRISDYEGQFVSFSVPTAAMREGDFSDPALTPIYDPATGNANGTGRTQFTGNIIPNGSNGTTNRLDPIAVKMVALVPLPNNNLTASGLQKYTNNWLAAPTFDQVLPSVDAKIDHYQSERDHITGWMSHLFPYTYQGPAFGVYGGPVNSGFEGSATDATWLGGLAWNHVFSPTFLTQTRIGFTRANNLASQIGYGQALATAIGIPGANLDAGLTSGMVQILGEGFSDPMLGTSASIPWIEEETDFDYSSSWTKIVRSHTLKWGGDARRIHNLLFATNVYGTRGTFDFAAPTTALSGGTNKTGFANQFASFMLGLPTYTARDLFGLYPDDRLWRFDGYFNDKWQVSSKVTANLGVRWDLMPPKTPAFPGGESNYDPSTNSLYLAGIGTTPMNLGVKERWHDLEPRIGLAYRLSPQNVVRAGFSIDFCPLVDDQEATNYPVTQTNYYSNSVNIYAPDTLPNGALSTFANGFPAPTYAPVPSNGIIPANTPSLLNSSFKMESLNYLDPYVEDWNLTYERTLPGQWTLDIGYVGNHGLRIPMRYNINAGFVTGAGASGQPLYALYGKTAAVNLAFATSVSSYNSLQVYLKHRFAAGHAVTIAYTYGHALGYGGECGENTCTTENYVDYRRNYARDDFDRRHAVIGSYVWDLPFGQGHKLFTTGVPKAIAGGWQFSGVLTLETGLPMNFGATGAFNTPGNTQTPNMNGPWHVLHGINTNAWFDTSVFSQPAANVFGNLGYYPFSGPGLFNWDASLMRQVRLTERFHLEFRTEWFSATNTPQFANPNTSFGSSTFGHITSTQQYGSSIQGAYGGNRIVDFAVKLKF